MIFDLPLQPSVDTEDNGEKLNNPFAAPIPLERFRGIQKNGVLTPVNINRIPEDSNSSVFIDNDKYTVTDSDPRYLRKNDETICQLDGLGLSIGRKDFDPSVLDVYSIITKNELGEYESKDIAICQKTYNELTGKPVLNVFGKTIELEKIGKVRFVIDSYFEGDKISPKLFVENATNQYIFYLDETGNLIQNLIEEGGFAASSEFFEIHQTIDNNYFCCYKNMETEFTGFQKYADLLFDSSFNLTGGDFTNVFFLDPDNSLKYMIEGEFLVSYAVEGGVFVEKGRISLPTTRDKSKDLFCGCRNKFSFQYSTGEKEYKCIETVFNNRLNVQDLDFYGSRELMTEILPKEKDSRKNDPFLYSVSTINGEEAVLGISDDQTPFGLIGGFTGETSSQIGNGGVFYNDDGTVWKIYPTKRKPSVLNDVILSGNLSEAINTKTNKREFFSSPYNGAFRFDGVIVDEKPPKTIAISIFNQSSISNSIIGTKVLQYVGKSDSQYVSIRPLNIGRDVSLLPEIDLYLSTDSNISKLEYQRTYPAGVNNIFLSSFVDPKKKGRTFTEGILDFLVPVPIWANLDRKNTLIGSGDGFSFLYALPPELTRSGKGETGYLNYFVDSFFDGLQASFYISGNLYVYQNGTIKQVTLDPNGAIRTVQRLTNNLEYRFIGNSSTEAFFLDEMNSRVYAFRGYWELERIFDFSDFPENYKIKGKVLYSFYSNSKDIFFFLFEGASGNEMLLIKDRNIVNILNPGDLYQYKTGEDLIVYENNQKIFLISVDSDTNKEKVFDIDFDVNGDHLDGLELLTEWIGFPGESETRLNKLFLNFDIGSSNIGEIEVNLWYKRNPIDVDVQKVKFQPEKTGRTTLQISPRVQNFNRFKIEVKIPPLKDWRILGISADITQGSQRLIKEQNKR